MPLEADVLQWLIGGFLIVMIPVLIMLVVLWIKNKRKTSAYVWTILQFLIFSVAVYCLIQAISSDPNHPMASEENSLNMGLAGVAWMVSVVCLVTGIKKFSVDKKE